MRWTEKDLIGPDGKHRGWPNNVSRAAVADMERRIAERFGEGAVLDARRACGVKSDWNRPAPRGSTVMYGAGYKDPAPPEKNMDETDPEWREAAYADGEEF